MNAESLSREQMAMNNKNKQRALLPTHLIGVLFLFLSCFFPWVSDPYSRNAFKPAQYVFQGVNFFSIAIWLQAILAIFIIIGVLKKNPSRWPSRLSGTIVIIELLILNFPALDSETRLPVQIGIGSILAVLAAILLLIPERTGLFSFLKKQKDTDTPEDKTIVYLGILLFLSCWLPWSKGYYSWFGKNLIDLLPGHKYIFYFPSLFIASCSALVLLGILKKNTRIPALISGGLFMAYFLYIVLMQGILQTLFRGSIGFFAALIISGLLLWKVSGKKIRTDSFHARNLLRADVLLAAILAVVFPLNVFPAHSQYSIPKFNSLFELIIVIVPFFALLSIGLVLINKNNSWARRTAGSLSLIFLILYFLTAGFYVIFLIKSFKGALEIIASLGLILIPANKKRIIKVSI
jgi:hypothetical protein